MKDEEKKIEAYCPLMKEMLVRVGECTRCGLCCEDEKCIHLRYEGDIAVCGVWDKLDKDCDECTKIYGMMNMGGKKVKRNHKVCVDAPDHPRMKCLSYEKCGFKFIKKPKEDGNSK